MPKKNLISEALIEAKELERASIENAKDIVLESFAPDFVNFFKDVLNESEDNDEDDKYGDTDPEEDELEEGEFKPFKKKGEDEEDEDEELEEGNEHDVGKKPDAGRQGTDPAVDDDEENQNQDMKEGNYDDVKGDPTPEKGQAGLPNKPKVKKVGDSGWEDEGASGAQAPDPEKGNKTLPGKKPSVKQTGDGGWEDEGASGAQGPDPEKGNANGLKGVPKAKVVKEADDEKDDDKEDKKKLDVPKDLFDDEDTDGAKGTNKNDEVDIKDDFDGDDEDVEIDIDVDDDEEDSTNEGVDVNIDSDDDEESDDDEDEEIDESLYIRQEGRYKKITPAEYLTTRIETLEEERNTLTSAVETLRGQLQETHLFNAKLAHLNKLYMSGAFTNSEKERIAERLDECDGIEDVKSLYKTIINEVQDNNPLDDFSRLIKEQRIRKDVKTENIYESRDVSRMKRIMDYEFE